MEEEETPVFGMKIKKKNKHIGNYVVLTPWGGGNQYSKGILKKVTETHYIINPHQGMMCDLNKGWLQVIVEKDEEVPILGTKITPIDKKSFINSIVMYNNEVLKQKSNQDSDKIAQK